MKTAIDLHVVLATVEDMEQWEDQAEEASDKLNLILHLLYDRAPEDIPVSALEKLIQQVWELWQDDVHLLDIEEDDLCDWVDQQLATWEDQTNEIDDI